MGSVAGGVAAFLTCPLDVLKTRIMLTADLPNEQRLGIKDTFMTLVREEGWRGLFYGVVPRVVWISLGGALWISIGGAIWFGAFEEYRRQLQRFMWCVFPTNSLHA